MLRNAAKCWKCWLNAAKFFPDVQFIYDINTTKEKANKSLNALITSQIGTINSQAETIAILK